MSVNANPSSPQQLEAVRGLGLAEHREAALNRALELPAPTTEAESWRYSPIGDLDLAGYRYLSEGPASTEAPAVTGLAADRAATVVVIDGFVTSIEVDEGWQAKGLTITAESTERSIAVDDPGQLDHLHLALAPQTLTISVKANLAVEAPVVIASHHSGDGVAAFSHIVVNAGENSELTVVERQTSNDGSGLSVPVVELDVANSARLRYFTVQELGTGIWQLARQQSAVGDQASLVASLAAFGGAYARLRTDTSLDGRGASGDLVAIYYGDAEQVFDFRTFQHHRGPNTQSDLLFKGTVDDKAGSIYTGLIQIHPDGRGSNANQTNRNIKLSEDAWAWSVPNLEIENNDVKCSHATTVSPVDADQRFYLHARGVPPTVADRLIVAGFFNEVVQRFGLPGVQDEVRRLVDAKLNGRP